VVGERSRGLVSRVRPYLATNCTPPARCRAQPASPGNPTRVAECCDVFDRNSGQLQEGRRSVFRARDRTSGAFTLLLSTFVRLSACKRCSTTSGERALGTAPTLPLDAPDGPRRHPDQYHPKASARTGGRLAPRRWSRPRHKDPQRRLCSFPTTIFTASVGRPPKSPHEKAPGDRARTRGRGGPPARRARRSARSGRLARSSLRSPRFRTPAPSSWTSPR
jgi:hypothetical protein